MQKHSSLTVRLLLTMTTPRDMAQRPKHEMPQHSSATCVPPASFTYPPSDESTTPDVCPKNICRSHFSAWSGLCQHIESGKCGVNRHRGVQKFIDRLIRRVGCPCKCQ